MIEYMNGETLWNKLMSDDGIDDRHMADLLCVELTEEEEVPIPVDSHFVVCYGRLGQNSKAFSRHMLDAAIHGPFDSLHQVTEEFPELECELNLT